MGIFDVQPEYTESGTAEFALEAFMRQQNQVGLAILTGPVLPMAQLAKGEDVQRVIGTQAAAMIETWLVYQALGYTASYGESWMAKQIVKRTIFPYQVMAGAGAIGIAAAMEIHGDSTTVEKTASLGGVSYGKSQKQRMSRLGGL